MQFTHEQGVPDITIRRTNFIDLKSLILDLNESLPYDAIFQSVTLV